MSRILLAGAARGRALVLDEPLSMWGGLDPASGEVIDHRHPQRGAVVTATILVMPHGRGSSSASSVFAEAIRLGTAPSAIVLREADDIVLLGALAAQELYGITCPVLVAEPEIYESLVTGTEVTITADGTIEIE